MLTTWSAAKFINPGNIIKSLKKAITYFNKQNYMQSTYLYVNPSPLRIISSALMPSSSNMLMSLQCTLNI